MNRLVLPVALTALLLAGCSDDAPTASGPAPVATSPSPSPSPSAVAATSSPPDETGAEGGVVLGGTQLGVTSLGEPMDAAVAAVSEVLGAPDDDPASAVRCIQSEREVRWGDFVLAGKDGRLAGWTSQSTTLQTPSGVTVGTDLATLRQVYGQGLQRFPANPDNPPTFAVDGVDVRGALSSADDTAVVTSLFTTFCSGP